jgi:DNA-binding response OmpR family regulator
MNQRVKTSDATSPSVTPPQIAVVEDDADLLASMLDYLHALGYPAWGVGSAEAFYKQLHMSPVDVLVLDIGLPGEDGLQLAAWVNRRVDLTVIIVSARDRLQDRLDGLAAGADRYLVKPVDLAELVANIDAAWRRSATTAATDRKSKPP